VAARTGRPTAADELERLTADAQQPSIVRATALDALRAYPGAAANTRLSATLDADAEIRAAAAASLENEAPEQRLQALAPLLQDPVRAVRIAAARALADVPTETLTRDQRTAFNAALEEYLAAQGTALDMPGPRLNLAVVYERLGRPSLAETEYLAALRIDPDFTPARANLAILYNRLSRNADAERVLIEGLAREPDIGELQYSLGLVLAEQGRLEEASVPLARAGELLPERARVHYNLGLALQQLGRFAEAETALRRGHAADADDPAIPYALAILFAQTGRSADAREWAELARLLAPDDPQIKLLVDRLRGG
jgi:tetratricopeptide (TPR) repeat protein